MTDQLNLSWQFYAATDVYLEANEAAMNAAFEADATADQLGMLDQDSPPKISEEQVPEYRQLYEKQHAEYSRLALKADVALRVLLQVRSQILPV